MAGSTSADCKEPRAQSTEQIYVRVNVIVTSGTAKSVDCHSAMVHMKLIVFRKQVLTYVCESSERSA